MCAHRGRSGEVGVYGPPSRPFRTRAACSASSRAWRTQQAGWPTSRRRRPRHRLRRTTPASPWARLPARTERRSGYDVPRQSAEAFAHFQEIRRLSEELGVAAGPGLPSLRQAGRPCWVPKARLWDHEALPAHARRAAIDMMLRTSTVQANLDYDRKSDAMRKRASREDSALCAALFAQAVHRGRRGRPSLPHGAACGSTGPDRSGLPRSL